MIIDNKYIGPSYGMSLESKEKTIEYLTFRVQALENKLKQLNNLNK